MALGIWKVVTGSCLLLGRLHHWRAAHDSPSTLTGVEVRATELEMKDDQFTGRLSGRAT